MRDPPIRSADEFLLIEAGVLRIWSSARLRGGPSRANDCARPCCPTGAAARIYRAEKGESDIGVAEPLRASRIQSTMARSRESIWIALASGLAGLGGVLLVISATFGAATKDYSTWTSSPAIAAYVLFVLAVACGLCAVFDAPIPLPRGAHDTELPAPAGAAEEGSALRSAPATASESDPVHIDVVRHTGGWFEAQNAIEWLTLFQLSRELWGDPAGGPFDFLRNRRKIADRLAESDQDIREHLDTVLRLVPDYSRNPYPYSPPERSAIGILAATVNVLVKVRNLGIEPGGVMLMSSAQPVRHPSALQPLDAWVDYQVKTDEMRHVVVPGSPVDIPMTVWMRCARTVHSQFPLDTSHALAIARVSRAFADFLRGPIDGIEVGTLLDGGAQARATLEIRIRAAASRCEVNELDLDELERLAAVLDHAIDLTRLDEVRKNAAELYQAASARALELGTHSGLTSSVLLRGRCRPTSADAVPPHPSPRQSRSVSGNPKVGAPRGIRSASLLGRRCCARKSHLNGCYWRAMSRFCCD